jgi:hypothetical protein
VAIVKNPKLQEPIDEQTMIHACAQRYDVSYFKFRNFFYRHDHEADLFVISKARYATEIEVKISASDWRADLSKAKHASHRFIKFFYYAVPEELAEKAPDGIDPRYGLLVCKYGNDGILKSWMKKEAIALPCEKVTKRMICKAFMSSYYRNFTLQSSIRSLAADNRHLRSRLSELEAAHVQ